MLAFVLSNIIGLGRQILISRAFGTGDAYDAFVAASRYPDLIFNLIAGGALASAFIPTFTGYLEQRDRNSAWKLAASIINLILIVLTTISIFSAIFSLPVVQFILAPDFSPEKQQLTASLLRVLLIAPTIFGVSGLLMGILNSHQHFLLPALAPSMYWLGMIFGLVFFVPSLGIFGLAWGAILGALLHFAIQVPALVRLPDWHYNLSIGWGNSAVREVLILMGPRLLGVAVVQINFVINTIIASGQPVGSVSSLTYAFQIMTMPEVAIAQAIAIAALPTFSAQIARGELGEMRHSLASTLRGVLLLSLPATLGLILLRYPLIALLFQRGKFDAHSTDMVAWALLWYTAGLVGHSFVEILSRAFYALHDTRTPVIVGTIAMSLNIVFSFGFSALFSRLGWMPHGGLALANSFATTLEMTALFILMRRRLRGIDGVDVWRGFVHAAVGTIGMSLVLLFWLQINDPVWLKVVGGVLLGGACYAAAVSILRVPEISLVTKAIGQRLKRSR
jgi:putative peptidoglycan lipid II flippase